MASLMQERAVLEVERETRENSPRQKHAFENRSLSQDGADNINESLCQKGNNIGGFLGSIKIVIFSAKLNILMIFGPIAIVVDKASGNQVSLCFFGSVLQAYVTICMLCLFKIIF